MEGAAPDGAPHADDQFGPVIESVAERAFPHRAGFSHRAGYHDRSGFSHRIA